MKNLLIVILVIAAGAVGWFMGRDNVPSKSVAGERKVAFYQSPMHPWIKSDKPGNCTICGMKLTPVYEGEKGFDTSSNMITLSSNAINVLNVQTETVANVPIKRTLEVAGRVEADQTRSRVLSAYVDGRVEKLFVNFNGAEVKAGEPLAVIYSPALLTAEREYLSVLAQTNFATSPRLAEEHNRFVEGAKQRLKRLGLTDEQIVGIQGSGAATNFTTQIVAPISGTVVKREVLEGQYVKEGDRMFELIDLSQLWFVFEVYEQDLPAVQLGQIVQVISPALPGRTFEGPIAFIEPTINEATRSARVRVELENPAIDGKRALYNGLYATGRTSFKSEPVLAVTRNAIIEPGDQARIYVDHGGGAYEQRIVQLGRRGEDYIEVLTGVEAGERVVSNGNLLLDNQAQISRGGANGSHQHAPGGEPDVSPTNHQHSAIAPAKGEDLAQFFAQVSGLAQALANDDVKSYNERLSHFLVPVTPELDSLTRKLKEQRTDALDAARVEFLPFSLAVAQLAEAVRKTNQNANVKVYKCPMFPRPGRDAFWIQTEGPMRNPFYGSEMIDCGTEVK